MIEITNDEASSLRDFIEYTLLDLIRNDTDVDDMDYVYNIVNIWKRCEDVTKVHDSTEFKEE